MSGETRLFDEREVTWDGVLKVNAHGLPETLQATNNLCNNRTQICFQTSIYL